MSHSAALVLNFASPCDVHSRPYEHAFSFAGNPAPRLICKVLPLKRSRVNQGVVVVFPRPVARGCRAALHTLGETLEYGTHSVDSKSFFVVEETSFLFGQQ